LRAIWKRKGVEIKFGRALTPGIRGEFDAEGRGARCADEQDARPFLAHAMCFDQAGSCDFASLRAAMTAWRQGVAAFRPSSALAHRRTAPSNRPTSGTAQATHANTTAAQRQPGVILRAVAGSTRAEAPCLASPARLP